LKKLTIQVEWEVEINEDVAIDDEVFKSIIERRVERFQQDCEDYGVVSNFLPIEINVELEKI